MSASLEQVSTAFRASLPASDMVSVFPITSLDRLGIPVCQAVAIPDSGDAIIGYGFGSESLQAEVGALGELCEEIHAGAHVARAPAIEASYASLLSQGLAAVDPLTLCLPAGSTYTPDLVLPWIMARRWPNREDVLVPREWVAAYGSQLPDEPRLITPITNGLGAGLDEAHAIAHGVLELLQRDGNVLSYRALDQGVVVTLDEHVPAAIQAIIAHLQSNGIRLTVKLAATDFGMANLYVVGDDTRTPHVPVQLTACGEAPHPDRCVALRKAVLEFAGSRARKAATHGPFDMLREAFPPDYFTRQLQVARDEPALEEPRAVAAMAEWVRADAATLRHHLAGTVFSARRSIAFGDLPTTEGVAEWPSVDRLSLLAERLASEGLEILWVDCSPPDSPVKVVKVIVPGLECETMSYHRIGWRGVHRLRTRCDALLLDHATPGALRVRLRPCDETRAGGPAWFDAATADRLVADLYPLYREPGPFAAQLFCQRQTADA